MLSPNDLVKEVARQVSEGHLCYVEKSSRQIISFSLDEVRTQEELEQIQKMEEYHQRYIKAEPMPQQTLIFAMKDFLPEVSDNDLRKELSNGLNRKNPTRNFLQVVDNRFEIKHHWANYFAEKYREYVGNIFIKDYNY